MKPGDKVRCIERDTLLDVGKEYTLVKVPYAHTVNDNKPIVAIDHGAGYGVYSYYASLFVLVAAKDKFENLKVLVALAESLLKTTVTTKARPLQVTKYEIFLDRGKAKMSSNSVLEEFDRSGFCVAVQGNQRSVPVQEVNIKPKELTTKLTNDYDAVVTKDSVQVGCQTISREKILELVKLMDSLR